MKYEYDVKSFCSNSSARDDLKKMFDDDWELYQIVPVGVSSGGCCYVWHYWRKQIPSNTPYRE